MMLGFLKKQSKKCCLVLDIGNQNTKIAILKKGQATVDQMILKPTPPDVFKDGFIASDSPLPDFLSQSILEMEIEEEIEVIMGISGKGIIAKKIDIPVIEESMIPDFVEIEAEQELFYNKEEMVLDYEVLEGVNFNKPTAKSLFVVTVLKKVIESYNNLVEKLSLNCEILDINFSALANCFENSMPLDKNKIYMVLDIGCVTTNLVILIKNQVVFARSLPLGGDFFTQGIQRKLSMDYSSAEELKISASKGQSAPEELVSLVRSELNESWIEEFMSSYELYHSLFPEKKIDQLYVTGGASQTLGLAAHLEKKTACPVKFFDPFQGKNIQFPPSVKKQEGQFFYAVLIGLATRAS